MALYSDEVSYGGLSASHHRPIFGECMPNLVYEVMKHTRLVYWLISTQVEKVGAL